jgi:anti-anti-sigma factor
MVHVAQGWDLDVQRGPDWLFVRPQCPTHDAVDDPQLAAQIWALLEQNFTHRLVLELDRLELLQSHLIGQLIWLYKRIHSQGGMMRICGLSRERWEVLRISQLQDRFPYYADRESAVMGHRPSQPR